MDPSGDARATTKKLLAPLRSRQTVDELAIGRVELRPVRIELDDAGALAHRKKERVEVVTGHRRDSLGLDRLAPAPPDELASPQLWSTRLKICLSAGVQYRSLAAAATATRAGQPLRSLGVARWPNVSTR